MSIGYVVLMYFFTVLERCGSDACPEFLVPPGTELSLTSNELQPHKHWTSVKISDCEYIADIA